jgi:DNA-binding NtrC family response regulator
MSRSSPSTSSHRFAAGRGRTAPGSPPEALAALQAYDWPGNVRELENALERAAVLSGGDGEIQVPSLPARITSERSSHSSPTGCRPTPARDHRARLHPLGPAGRGGNKTRAAEVLGIDPSTLYRKLVRYGIQE